MSEVTLFRFPENGPDVFSEMYQRNNFQENETALTLSHCSMSAAAKVIENKIVYSRGNPFSEMRYALEGLDYS